MGNGAELVGKSQSEGGFCVSPSPELLEAAQGEVSSLKSTVCWRGAVDCVKAWGQAPHRGLGAVL